MTTTQMPTLIDQLGEAALAAKGATREAHQAVRDLRAAARESREAEASLRRALAEAADTVVDKAIASAIDRHAEAIVAGIQPLVDRCVHRRVTREVDTINNCLTDIAYAAGVPATLLGVSSHG